MEADDILITCENLVIDLTIQTVTIQGQPVLLTPLEFNALAYLAKNQTRFVNAEELLAKVWKCEDGGTLDQVKSCLKRLRQKLAAGSEDAPNYIQSARGWGYRFCSTPPDETDTELTRCRHLQKGMRLYTPNMLFTTLTKTKLTGNFIK